MDHKAPIRKTNKLFAAIAGLAFAGSSALTHAVTNASTVDLDFQMTCSFPLVGSTLVTVKGEADVPASTVANRPITDVGIRFSATLDAQTIGALKVVDLGFLGGNVDVEISIEQPTSTLPIKLPIALEKGQVPTEIAPYDLIKGNGTAPTLRFGRGPVNVYIDQITTKIEGFERDGTPANGAFDLFTDVCEMDRYLVRTVQVAPAEGASVGLSTAAVDFGKVAPGVSASETITVSSTGMDDLTIADITFVGDSGFAGSQTCIGQTLSNGDTCTITPTFTGSSGTSTGTLTIVSNAPTNSTVTMSATSTSSGTLKIADTVDFGSLEVGQNKTKEVSIANTGNAALTITGLEVAGGDFVLSDNTCGTVAPGDSCVATFDIAPSTEGSQTGTLTVTSDDPDMGSKEVMLNAAVASAQDTGDTTVSIALSGEGQVEINAVAAGKANLSGFFDGTIDREDGQIVFDMELDKTSAKLTGLGFLPLRVTMSLVQTRPILGEFVNSEMSFTAYLDVYLETVALSFFGFPIRLAGGQNCKIIEEREIPFASLGKVDLAGGTTPINGPLYLGRVEKCGPINIFLQAFMRNLASSPIDLDLTFVKPAL